MTTRTTLAQAGRYALLDELGEGGMGAVYRAQDRASRKVVAFKQLRSAAAGAKRRTIEALFEREYHTLVRLKHPRIIEVYDYGFTELGPYYTMELLDGKDLQQLAPLPAAEVCRHLRDVASSLALIHAQRLVHRDVSARNVRLTADGRAKLIDFGALSTFGIATEVAGTPPCMAPEMLRRLPLDQRADLYSLGAIGYLALTGRYPYSARTVHDLPRAWQELPAPPSHYVAGVPEPLDALIMSLLSLDPLARPATAAAVIDQLTAIAGLEPEPHELAAASYLSSGRLVGRNEEQQWLRQKLSRALQGYGTEVVLEGVSGIGKTRLLHELCLEAQIRGGIPLRADAQASSRPFAVAATLAVQLLATCPESARRAAEPHAGLLAHLLPELADALATTPHVELAQDPAERRARFQTALHELFLAVAADQPLLVAVDNAHAADDNSAAFIAALGRSSRNEHLLVLCTQTIGDDVVAPIPIAALRKRSALLKLAGLSERACDELVASLFGNVANTGRLSKLLYEKTGGNPQHCMDLAQLLVRRKVIEYVDGAFVLPHEFAADELPNRVEELLREKLAALGPEARSLCETLSIHEQRVSIERCVALAELNERDTYRALDELVAEQILVADGVGYGFRQQAVRESVLARVDPVRRRTLHMQAAENLLADPGQGVAERMDAGFHLLHAGEEERGADIMAGAARAYLRHQGVESVEQVVRAIEAALALYEKQSRSKYQIASMLFPLMSLAFFVDWRVTLKHGERAIRLGLDITGLDLAQRLSRYLPNIVALGIGLITAAARFVPHQLRGLRFNLIEAIEQFCSLVPPVVGTLNIVFDLPAMRRAMQLLEPLKLFGRDHIAALMYDFSYAQYLMAFGREEESRALLERLRDKFPDPAIRKVLGELHWKALYGGILFSLGVVHPYAFGDRALDVAREMEGLGVRVWAMAADEIRMLHHALRGNSEAVNHYRERVELFAVQGSTTWQADIFWPLLLLDGDIRAADAFAVRTVREQLARRAKDHPSLGVFAQVAHAAYLTLRGEHRAAIASFEEILERARSLDPAEAWTTFRGCFAYAQALNGAGEHERARQYVAEVLARAGAEVEHLAAHYLEPQRQLALAEAGLGRHAEAAARLDALLARHAGQRQPLLIGLLHKARAEVALGMGDADTFDHHFREMEQIFAGTRNPALIAQCEQLLKRARRESLVVGMAETAAGELAREASVSSLTGPPSGASRESERGELALRLILQDPRAKAGYLYLLKNDRLELAAASDGSGPPSGLVEQLLRDVQRARERALADSEDRTAVGYFGRHGRAGAKSVFIESIAGAAPSSALDERHRVIVLSGRRRGDQSVIGGVIVELHYDCAFALDLEQLEPITSALHGT